MNRPKDHLFFIVLTLLLIGGFATFINHIDKQEAIHRQLVCLAKNVYHESRGEPDAGQYAVAEVTMNRVASKRYPDSICDVVYEKRWDRIRKRYVGAFSWTELEDLGSTPDRESWKKAWEVANAVYFRKVTSKVKGALFYHSRHIRPSWARRKEIVAAIGHHVFYK